MTKRVEDAVNAAKAQFKKANASFHNLMKSSKVSESTTERLESKGFCSIEEGLWTLYEEKILPLELEYSFHWFTCHSQLFENDFYAKPVILIMGPYSSGKTSLIQRLLKCPYPNMRTGPEPTTDKFTIIGYTQESSTVPGAAAVVDNAAGNGEFSKNGLEKFGSSFFDHLQSVSVCSEMLKQVTIVDTPGILSVTRSYDYIGALEWFAEKSDFIILMMDALKPDVPQDLKTALSTIKRYSSKMRVILNKADELTDPIQLMKVYGSLLWSLGQAMEIAEAPEVLPGSFWGQGIKRCANQDAYQENIRRLDKEIIELPQSASLKRIDQIVKRARQAKAHGYLMCHLKENYPNVLKKGATGRMSVSDLREIYEQVVSKYQVSMGDLPDAGIMRKKLRWAVELQLSKNEKLFEDIDSFLEMDSVMMMSTARRKEPLRLQAIFGRQLRKVIAEHIPPHQHEKFEDLFKRCRDKTSRTYGADTISLIEVNEAIKEEGCGDSETLDEKGFGMLWDFADDGRQGFLTVNDFILFMHLVDHWCRGEKSTCISLVEKFMKIT